MENFLIFCVAVFAMFVLAVVVSDHYSHTPGAEKKTDTTKDSVDVNAVKKQMLQDSKYIDEIQQEMAIISQILQCDDLLTENQRMQLSAKFRVKAEKLMDIETRLTENCEIYKTTTDYQELTKC